MSSGDAVASLRLPMTAMPKAPKKTRKPDADYCMGLCTDAGPTCSGFVLNTEGCFFRSGPLLQQVSSTDECFEKLAPKLAYHRTNRVDCQGSSKAHIVSDGTDCDAPVNGKYGCTRKADVDYCQQVCSDAGAQCTGFSYNPTGCFFRSGPLSMKPAPGSACYEKAMVMSGIMQKKEPGSYLGEACDVRTATFDPTKEGVCSLSGRAISDPKPKKGFVVPKTAFAPTADEAQYFCVLYELDYVKAVEFHVVAECGGMHHHHPPPLLSPYPPVHAPSLPPYPPMSPPPGGAVSQDAALDSAAARTAAQPSSSHPTVHRWAR